MADLTLERIAELRANHRPITAERGIDAAMKVIEVLPALLDAAERGLTAMAWTVNGPDVEKPEGRVLVHTMRYGTGCGDVSKMLVAEWGGRKDLWVTDGMWWPKDDEVTHFMAIKEPTDA